MITTPTVDDDGVAVVEAPSAEEALDQVQATWGSEASIVEATKVLRGGIGGFFAREVVQLRVRPPRRGPAAEATEVGPSPAAPPPDGHRPPGGSTPPGGAVDRLLADEQEREETFGELLRRQMRTTSVEPGLTAQPATAAAAVGEQAAPREPGSPGPAVAPPPPSARPAPPAPSAAPAPPAAAPAPQATAPVAPEPAVPRRPEPGAPDWSVDNLLRLGLPELVVRAVRDLSPADDAAWIAGIGSAVASLCRPLPAGPAVVIGPRAHRLGRELGMPVVTPPEPAPTPASFAARFAGSARDQGWLSWLREERWVHAVAGGARWRSVLLEDPLAISWVGDDALPEALRCAAELGLVLGYELRRSTVRRANPVDVAVAIRDLVPRR